MTGLVRRDVEEADLERRAGAVHDPARPSPEHGEHHGHRREDVLGDAFPEPVRNRWRRRRRPRRRPARSSRRAAGSSSWRGRARGRRRRWRPSTPPSRRRSRRTSPISPSAIERGVLRRVPERPRHVVDPHAAEGPGGHGIDVHVAQCRERRPRGGGDRRWRRALRRWRRAQRAPPRARRDQRSVPPSGRPGRAHADHQQAGQESRWPSGSAASVDEAAGGGRHQSRR